MIITISTAGSTCHLLGYCGRVTEQKNRNSSDPTFPYLWWQKFLPFYPKGELWNLFRWKLKQYLHFGFWNINHCTETFTTKNNSKKICSYFAKEEVAVMALRKQRQSHIEYFKGLWSRNKLGDRYKLLIVFSICSSQPHCIGVKTKFDSWCLVYTRAKNDGDGEKG